MTKTKSQIQDEAMDAIHKIAREAGIEYVLICDADIRDRLEDEPEKLAKIDDTKVSRIKSDIVDGLMENFMYVLDEAIENHI